jgi:uncharacterized protein YrrD
MLFFSNVLGAEVKDQADAVIGTVHDIIIKTIAEGFPPVFAVVVVGKKKKKKIINATDIETFGKDYVTLKSYFSEIELPETIDKNLVSLRETVLDRQIVDMAGVRVVRVNDLQFGMIQGMVCLVALDIGKLGLLRRLGLDLHFFNFLRPELVEWNNVRLLGDKLQLSMSGKELVKLHPADIANIIEKLNLNQGSELLEALDKKNRCACVRRIGA